MAAATGTVPREGARTLRPPVVELDGVTQVVGGRTLWSDLTLRVEPGEFLAVLGPNGAGKTTLVRLVLGLLAPTSGRVLVNGGEPQEQRGRIGYVPQQRAFDRDLLLRGRDLVRLGLDGNRWGVSVGGDGGRLVDDALAAAGATAFADRPLGRLSGGEQQRLRIAQALVRQPELILADEPLLSLDLAQQRTTVELIARQRSARGTPVVFVTHDVNPLLDHVDRVLYLSGSAAAVGSVEEVLTSETLSRLYDTAVDVLRVRDRIVVVGAPDTDWHHH